MSKDSKELEFLTKEIAILENDNAKLNMGNLAHGIVLSYFKRRKRELDEKQKV
jgi:hypothetical protein